MVIPVTVVLGLPGAGKSHWIARQLSARPDSEHWAVLGPGWTDESDVPGTARRTGLLKQPLGPGCACCALRPALAQALLRVLRAGPCDHLIIEADGAAHPERLVAALREPPFATALTIGSIVLLIDGRQTARWRSVAAPRRGDDGLADPRADDDAPADPRADDTRHGALLAAASLVVINRPPADADAWAARLAAAAPFGRQVTIDDGRDPAVCGSPPPVRMLARWSATPAFDRRALLATLTAWAARHPGLSARGAWPTARAWYAWDREPGRPDRWEVSAYCLEARLETGDGHSPEPFSVGMADAYAELVAAIDRLRDPVCGAATARSSASAAHPSVSTGA